MNTKKKIINKYFNDLLPEDLEYIERQIQFEKMKDIIENREVVDRLGEVKKYKTFRYENGIKRCQICNTRLINDTHHYLCDTCWKEKYPGKML